MAADKFARGALLCSKILCTIDLDRSLASDRTIRMGPYPRARIRVPGRSQPFTGPSQSKTNPLIHMTTSLLLKRSCSSRFLRRERSVYVQFSHRPARDVVIALHTPLPFDSYPNWLPSLSSRPNWPWQRKSTKLGQPASQPLTEQTRKSRSSFSPAPTCRPKIERSRSPPKKD